MTETAVAEAPVTSTGKQETELFRQSYLINIPKHKQAWNKYSRTLPQAK